MNDTAIIELVFVAQQGDVRARDKLIKQSLPFIKSTCYQVCKRNLEWENDDEFSVAMLAFNDAIDDFDPKKKASFFTFARKVISQRLIDYFRKENRHQHLPLDKLGDQEGSQISTIESSKAKEEYELKNEQAELAEMMLAFDQKLSQYGTSLDELADICPKHQDTRETLLQVAHQLVTEGELFATFQRNKRIPAKRLAKLSKVSTRVLENGRKYIIALVIIMTEKNFTPLKSFVGLDQKGGW